VIRPPPNLLGGHLEYEVNGIYKWRNPKEKGRKYFMKWLGYNVKEAT
jgi:hypothetical protein